MAGGSAQVRRRIEVQSGATPLLGGSARVAVLAVVAAVAASASALTVIVSWR
jgi:hypothetical protein